MATYKKSAPKPAKPSTLVLSPRSDTRTFDMRPKPSDNRSRDLRDRPVTHIDPVKPDLLDPDPGE